MQHRRVQPPTNPPFDSATGQSAQEGAVKLAHTDWATQEGDCRACIPSYWQPPTTRHPRSGANFAPDTVGDVNEPVWAR